MALKPETVDAWRIVPRLMVVLYGYVCWSTHVWFVGLEDPSGAQQLYASVIWGAAVGWFGFYVKTGNHRGEQ